MKLPHQWGKRTKGIDIPKRLKKLNISVLDLKSKVNSIPKTTKKGNDSTSTNKQGLKIPQDIASSILFQANDFSTLKSLILVNKRFFGAFQSYRISLMHAVAVNMFGVETVKYALALAGFMDKPSLTMSADGAIVLAAPERTTPLPFGTVKQAQYIHDVVGKWVELYEIRKLWLNVQKKKGRAKASDVTTQKFSPTEEKRFRHALVTYWVYSFCANYIERKKASPFEMGGMKKSGLCGYFSNVELAEIMAIFNFFEKVLEEACEDCQISGDDGFLYWQGYCLSLGPSWFLRLLDDYSVALMGTYGGQHEGFGLYDMMTEGDARSIDVGYGDQAHLTDAGHQALAERWLSEGIDGSSRPSNTSHTATLN